MQTKSETPSPVLPKGRTRLIRMVRIALMAAVTAVCAWITVPAPVPFTLQTFAVFLALILLGGKDGTISIAVYIAAGAAGVPVFSGFRGGVAVLAGATGGYILGFLTTGLLYWLVTAFRKTKPAELLSLAGGLLLCYLFGTVWFLTVSGGWAAEGGIRNALTLCVVPFLIPDGVKLLLAFLIGSRVRNVIPGARSGSGS